MHERRRFHLAGLRPLALALAASCGAPERQARDDSIARPLVLNTWEFPLYYGTIVGLARRHVTDDSVVVHHAMKHYHMGDSAVDVAFLRRLRATGEPAGPGALVVRVYRDSSTRVVEDWPERSRR